MGGNINILLRLNDGTEYRMERWTNIMPYRLANPDFLNGDQKKLEEFLEQWKLMKADWEKHKEDGKFELNMTSVYAPYPAPFAPSEYGVIVIDFKTKTVLSCNGYCKPGDDYILSTQDDELVKEYNEYYKKGLIEKIYDDPKNKGSIKDYYFVRLDPKKFGWKFIHYHDNAHNMRKLRKEVLKLGIVITKEENKLWDEWIKHREE